MKTIFMLPTLLSTFLLTACTQTAMFNSDEAPQWLHGESEMYPDALYLSATGSAAKAEQAKARAQSNLAKIFEVRIREVASAKQEVQTSTVAGVEAVQKSQSLTSTVNLSTDKMVQGVRIAEQWYNSTDLTFHALAVLDRKQAGNNIRQEMNRLDEETSYMLEQQKTRSDPLLKIADLQQAYKLQQDRKTLQQTLKIIDTRGRGVPAQWNLAELDEQLHQAIRALPLQTTVKVDDVGGLLDVLQGAAAEAGFDISGSGYQLAASLDSKVPFKRDNWYWQRATLELELIDTDGVTVIGYQSWPLKVSAGESSQLQPRMLAAADKKLKQQLFNSMLEFVK